MDAVANLLPQIIQMVYGPINRRIHYVTDLKENVETLVKKAKDLESKRLDIESAGKEALRNDQRLLNQVVKWSDDVEKIQVDITVIKTEFDKGSTIFNGCCPDYWSRYKLGKRAKKMLEEGMKDIIEMPNSGHVAVSSSPPRVLEMSVASTEGQSTAEETLEDILGHLSSKKSGIICVYGMGGIGKTTLMKTINNRLVGTQDFDIVIWLTASKEYNMERVQKETMSRLCLNCKDNESKIERSSRLYIHLKEKRYVLLLDDLWDDISLDEVGFPKPDIGNGSKIVITTRFVQVGNRMKADKMIKVETLTDPDAWNLFLTKVGKEVALLPEILPLANDVVKECSGLPLAISVVGAALRNKDDKKLWENVLTALRGVAPDKIEGMEPKVFLLLKLSYDHLESNKIKTCFLYCSLFPEDYEIDVDELIAYWVMENLLDNDNNLVEASNLGYGMVERITDACLLEKVRKGDKYFVKMHDLIRDIALWITSPASSFASSSSSSTSSSSSNQVPKFFVRAGVDLKEAPNENMWSGVEKISLMINSISRLPPSPPCHNLVSLLMRENPSLPNFPPWFFYLMPSLEILDLSSTSIEELTLPTSSLEKLRALILRKCENLKHLSSLGHLKQLQFLDVSHTSIRTLPKGLDKLVNLKKLDLSHLKNLSKLPQNVISRLTNLEDLRILETNIKWAKEGEREATLGEVATLTKLIILEITICDIGCLVEDVFDQRWSTFEEAKFSIGTMNLNEIKNDFTCKKLMRISVGDSYPHGVVAMLKHMEGLILAWSNVKHVSQLIGDSKSLRMIHIQNCEKLKSLLSSEMVRHLNQLEFLHVMHCDELEEIIQGNVSLPDNPLPKLRSLKLVNLRGLKSIIQLPTIALPALKEFHNESCPVLSIPQCHSIANIQSKNGLQPTKSFGPRRRQ